MESLLKPVIKTALIKAIGHELYAHNMYKNLANQMQGVGYFTAQKFFIEESNDELTHYQKIVDYINDRCDIADMPMVEAMKDKCVSLKQAFDVAYGAEYDLGLFYSKLYEQCESAGDCTTGQFILQFIEIQRISVGAIKDVQAMIKLAASDPSALFLVESKLV